MELFLWLVVGMLALALLGALAATLATRRRQQATARELSDLSVQHETLRRTSETFLDEHEQLKARYRSIVDVDIEKQRVLAELERERAAHGAAVQQLQEEGDRLRAEGMTLQGGIEQLRAEHWMLEEEALFQSFGLYEPQYDYADSARYRSELELVRKVQKQLLRDDKAAICHTKWTIDGNQAAGRRSTQQLLKLILRAFNGECDAAIAKVRHNNFPMMEARIRKAWTAINQLASPQHSEISRGYLDLKLQELRLVYEHQEKLQQEREEQRRIREEMREEERAQKELERATREAEKEEQRYAAALRRAMDEVARATGEEQAQLLAQVSELERQLADAHTRRERALARAQMTRAGHVYVISNIGSFGENVFKIGMTRRLEPMDRIRELGDASVPFPFDVHAILYSDDAPTLEAALHRHFTAQRVNRVNERKEFFHVTLEEIAAVVRRHHGEITLTRVAEAADYRRTLAMRRDPTVSPRPSALAPVA